MQEIKDFISQQFQTSPELTVQVIETIAAITILWFIRFIAVRIVNNRIKEDKLRYKWRKNLGYIISILLFLVLIQIWFSGIQSLATFLGLVSAGIAIALREPLTSLAGWLFLIWRRPFDVGDRIQVGEHKGDVIDVRAFKFTLLEIGNWIEADQSTGRVIHLPNHKVFSESIINYTSDFEFIWNELKVLITFESDWKKAKKILQDIADKNLQDFVEDAERQIRRAAKSYLIHYRYLTPIVYTDVKDSGVMLTIRYLTDPRKRRGTSQSMWEDILEEFRKHDDIDFAYPTIRYYDNTTEGKPGPQSSS